MFVLAFGITLGPALIEAMRQFGAPTSSFYQMSIWMAGMPVMLALVATYVAQALQKYTHASFSFGLLARWSLLVLLGLAQIAPVWMMISK